MEISPLTDLAYQGILAYIDRERLQPEQKLPGENTMAEMLGVSRPVIRQALARLRTEGWVVARKGSGNYVGQPALRSAPFGPIKSLAEVRAFLEYRCVIEGECAAWAARNTNRKIIEEISARRRLLELAVHRGTESIEEDIAFHEAIAKACDNHFYLMTMAAIRDHRRMATRLIREFSAQPNVRRVRDIREEHAAIDAAIVRGNPEDARRAMVAHIRGGIVRLFGKE